MFQSSNDCCWPFRGPRASKTSKSSSNSISNSLLTKLVDSPTLFLKSTQACKHITSCITCGVPSWFFKFTKHSLFVVVVAVVVVAIFVVAVLLLMLPPFFLLPPSTSDSFQCSKHWWQNPNPSVLASSLARSLSVAEEHFHASRCALHVQLLRNHHGKIMRRKTRRFCTKKWCPTTKRWPILHDGSSRRRKTVQHRIHEI